MLNSIKPSALNKPIIRNYDQVQATQQHSQPSHDCVSFGDNNETKEELNNCRSKLWKSSIKESKELYKKRCEEITQNNLSFPKLIKQYSQSLKKKIDQSNTEINKQYELDKKSLIAKFDAKDEEIQNKLDALDQNKSKN